jgi:fructose/tagatose bisphosphate aldolase
MKGCVNISGFYISKRGDQVAAFGNVHSVYKSGNVKHYPDLLEKHREYAASSCREL